jgi:thiol:disulfide interchange protein DsbD
VNQKHYHGGYGGRRRTRKQGCTKSPVASVLFRVLCGVVFGLSAIAVGHTQGRGVSATLTPLLERDAVAGGRTVRAALQVALPEGFHVQSDQPRDPTLIPTVLTVNPPAGVTVTEIVFPTPVDLKQFGLDQPLAVFERVFPIGVQLTLARSIASGDIIVPAHLRYQACNDTTCFAPKTAGRY